MAINGYFELISKDEKMWLKVHVPEAGGDMFDTDEVVRYLNNISISDYDLVGLDNYMKKGEFMDPFLLLERVIIPERERCSVTITPKGERALARFYPPTTGGSLLTEDDIISDLRLAGIKHGIKKKAIEHFLNHHEYCRDYIIAEATPPVHGHDAKIRYFFDINTTARPKLNEDGSVDFHQLGNIKAVSVGDKLAQLTPVDRGRAGISVIGTPLPAKKVKNRMLRFGRNISISEDRCTIYSKVAGHVTLVDDMVMVSDVYEVPANVDASTGDIDYKGTVQVAGNVNTGFKIKAEGDIIVNGVVEGAILECGGNIVLKRGMQGMDRGELHADGNITAKFLENCKVYCKGSLKADAVLHSHVDCQEEVEILGRKGLINGGSVRCYAGIHATTLGSTMGASTEIEIYSDKELTKRTIYLQEKIEEIEKSLKQIDKVAETVKKLLAEKQEVAPEQLDYIKKATVSRPILVKELHDMRYERESLLGRIERYKRSCIKVEDAVYAGVKIVVKEVTKNVHDHVSHCKFVRDGADVRMIGL